ncbi:MAG: hypothetical protein H3C35_04040 [Bacteroidetes bacterium]|nr:hypothetical protein [Bacteroidota bacterium]
MKKYISTSLLLSVIVVLCAGLLSSCKKKVEAPVVTDWVTFQNQLNVNGTELQYPQGWIINSDPKHIKVYSSQEVSEKFYEVYAQGSTTVNEENSGVEIDMTYETYKDAGVGNLEEYKAKEMKDFSALNLGNETAIVMGKENGVEYSFKVKVGKETTMQGKKLIVSHDSAFYTLTLTGFNEYFDAYKPIFDKIVESVKLPKPKIRSTDPNEILKPTKELVKYSNDFVEFMQPDNFIATPSEKKAGALFALHVEVENGRKDCTIDMDVFPTKTDKGELKFERFVDDNKTKFKAKTVTDAHLDGLSAKTLTDNSIKNIERKVYFVQKGDKLYRIILTWYKPMSADFQPAFENLLNSMKLK